MGTKYDQFVKDVTELSKIDLTLKGKKIELMLKGTYLQMKKQYRKLLMTINEDSINLMLKDKKISAVEAKKAKEAVRFLNGVYGYIDHEKSVENKDDNEVCTLIDIALASAGRARSTSRSGGTSSGPRSSGNASSGQRTSGPNSSNRTSSGPNSSRGTSSGQNTSRSGSSTNGANSNKQSSQSSTNQRASSGSSNTGRQTGGTKTDQQSKSSSYSNGRETIEFKNGTLKMVLNERKTQKTLEGRSDVYEYELTDKRGNTFKIYSGNTFVELSSEDMRSDIEAWLLSSYNIKNAKSFDVQDGDSQYGYVGMLEKTIYGRYNRKRDTDVISILRSRELQKVQELKFGRAKLKRLFNGRNVQKMLEGEYGVYEYEYTSEKGVKQIVYCGNTFEELSEPDIKYYVEEKLLTSYNLSNAKSSDVQNRDSQYGFIGKLNRSISGYYNREIDDDVIRRQRNKKLKDVRELKFDIGTVKVVLDGNGKQKTLEGESDVYEYEYTNTKGVKQTIYCGNTFEELSEPDIKYYVEEKLLTSYNLSNAKSSDVQNRDSQYGFIGKLNRSISGYYNREIDDDVIRRQRNKKLKDVRELKFDIGTVKVVLDGNGKQKTLEGESGVYEYEFTNPKGKTQTIYCENTFEELSNPSIKYYVEERLLTSYNLRKADSYDVQDAESQFGYVGKLEQNITGYYSRKIDSDLIRRQRNRKLRDIHELKFDVGTIKEVLNENGTQKTLEGQSHVYEYEYTNSKKETQTIYCENPFGELADPDIKRYVGEYLLSSSNLKSAKSHDVRDDGAQFGYVGKLVRTNNYVSYTRKVNPDVVRELRNRQLRKKNLNFTMAMDDVNTQKTITLQDGRKLYGYRLFDGKNPEDPGKELYVEEDPVELAGKMDRLKINKGFTHAEMMYAFDIALQNAHDFSTDSRRAQFGYAGSLGDDGSFKVNRQIVEELRDRIKAIDARSKFMSLAERENRILDELRNSGR